MEEMEDVFKQLKKGKFILLHDSENREDETDMVVLSEHVKPEHIARMRTDAGGLICEAVGNNVAKTIGLPFMADVLIDAEKKYPLLTKMRGEDIKYDKKSAFSLTVNHRKTFTGISDVDRALTISELGIFCRDIKGIKDPQTVFGTKFRSPGHIPLLISSGLESRQGHTELTCAIAEMGDLTPCVVVCEMMDEKTHKSLTLKDARTYAKKNDLALLEGKQVIEGYKKWRG
jgi:3,4-dihydroxy 2-butanone 4-phosphate synthase